MQRAYATRGLRFLPKLTLAITAGLITAAASYAVDVFTDPVGFITISAQGTTAAPWYNYFALGMTQIPAVRGSISSSSGNQIVTGSTLTPGQFALTSDGFPAYFVEVLDGANPGLLDDVTNNTATTLFTASADAPNITGATQFKVYPHWTIGTVFGPQNQ